MRHVDVGLGARLFTPESPRPTLECGERARPRPAEQQETPQVVGVQLCQGGPAPGLPQPHTSPESHQSIKYYAPLIMPTLSFFAMPFPLLSSHPPSLLRGFGGAGTPLRLS